MKIKYDDNLIIIYLYKYILDIDNKDKLYNEIKNLFIILIKKYKLNLFGYYKIDLYENKKYGFIMEINKIYGDNTEFIDLKIILHKNTKFYLVMEEYPFFDINNIIYKNKKYYIDIKNIDNLEKYIEFGNIEYDK